MALGTAEVLDARDVRSGGRWSRWQSVKNTALCHIVMAGLALADRLPARVLLAATRGLGFVAWLLLGSARQRAHCQIAAALPELDAQKLARRCFVAAGESLAFSLLLRRPAQLALELVAVDAGARAVFERALAEGRGAIVVSPHLGPFELIAAAVAELGLRPAIVVRESYDPRLNRAVDLHRHARGIAVIHRGERASSLKVLRALRLNRPVGLLPDLPGRVAKTPMRLFGLSAELAIGPARLAAGTRAPLLACWLSRAAGRKPFALHAEQLLVGVGSDDPGALTQCVADAMVRAVRGAPELWLWMAPIFRLS